jgi:predicted lipoprotein with Yx(FWY)xxD motif
VSAGADGKTLYLFEKDSSNTSTCYDACAATWPPALTNGAPVAASGVDASKLSTTQRTDGKTQIVYNNHPLYFFRADVTSGSTLGQDVNAFGGSWYTVNTAGNKVESS